MEIPEISFRQKAESTKGFEIYPLEKLRKRQIGAGHNPTDYHKVMFYIIMLITEGAGAHSLDFKTHKIQRQSLILIKKEQVHRFINDSFYDGYMILFTEDFLMENLLTREFRNFSLLYEKAGHEPFLHLSDINYQFIKGKFSEIIDEYNQKPDSFSENILRSYLKLIILNLERTLENHVSEEGSRYDLEQYRRLLSLVERWGRNERDVAFFADELGLSYKSLNGLCHRLGNRTAKETIALRIILFIQRELAVSQSSIQEISDNFHFDEPTNFIKFFKRYAGMTPKQFRQRCKG